jgi:hypothetical protein
MARKKSKKKTNKAPIVQTKIFHQHYLRQQRRCYWCGFECVLPATGSPSLTGKQPPAPFNHFTRDHILPRHTGESIAERWWNIVGDCNFCNNRRDYLEKKLTPESWRPEDLRFARITGIDPTGCILTKWLQTNYQKRSQEQEYENTPSFRYRIVPLPIWPEVA